MNLEATMRQLALLFLVAALAASCTTEPGTSGLEVAVAKASADSLWTLYATAADQHDAIGFGALFTPGATLAFDGAPTAVGRDAIQKALVVRYADFDATGFRVRPDDFKVSGTLAVQGGAFEADGTEKGKAQTHYGRYVMVMEHGEDKRWLIARLTAFTDSVGATTLGAAGQP
jgi:uncharacterized protein (TIGR02246 family)